MCGAVTAAATEAKLGGHLPALISNIQPAVAKVKAANPDLQGKALVPAAIEANVRLGMENLLTRSEEIRTLVAEQKLLLVGGVYDLASGEVKWLGEHPNQKQLVGSQAPKSAEKSSEKPTNAAVKSH